MTDSASTIERGSHGLRRLTPKAGERVQLFSAAAMWAIGASILLIRGVGFLNGSWFAALIALALVLGVLKSRLLLDRVARKAVARIHERGRACYFGFFSWKSWLFVALMMGGGIFLRNSGLPKDVLAVVYVGVGSGLVVADRIFWQAAVGWTPRPDSEAVSDAP